MLRRDVLSVGLLVTAGSLVVPAAWGTAEAKNFQWVADKRRYWTLDGHRCRG